MSVLFAASCGAGAPATAVPEAAEADQAAEAEAAVAEAAAAAEAAAELAAQAGPKYGGTLTMGIVADTLTLDPAFQTAGIDMTIIQMVYDNLLMIQADLSVKPELATSWEANDDLTSFTFHLRKGVKFNHGKEFKAEDVLYSFNRLRDPELGSAALPLVQEIEDIVALDDYTVRIDLSSPNGFFLESLSGVFFRILPSDVDPARMALEEFGTGPFILEEYLPGERATMVRNPDYWEEGKPYLDEIVILGIGEVATRTEALQSGDVDLLIRLDAQSLPSIDSHPDTVVLKGASGANLGLDMDNTKPPFDNILVRKAFQLALDRNLIVQASTLGLGSPASDHPIPPNEPRFAPQYAPPDYDPDLARSLLEQAGYPDGIDVTLHTSNVGPGMVEAAVAFKESAEPAGIRVDVQTHPSDGYWSEVFTIVPFSVVNWPGKPSPNYTLTAAYHSEARYNASHYSNPTYDALIERARGESLEDQKATYAEVQRLLIEEVPRLVAAFQPNLWGVRTHVRNADPHPFGYRIVQDIWLEEEN